MGWGARQAPAVDSEDMTSWGVPGLPNATETYDPERRNRAKFESFANSKIRWAILDELRGPDWRPRRTRA